MRQHNREGFTLIEILVAVTVITIVLGGVSMLISNVLKKASLPDALEQAGFLATERLGYFRGCPNSYLAAGGTYYPPPRVDGMPDYNQIASYNNNFNTSPQMMVREFLYDLTENQKKAMEQGAPGALSYHSRETTDGSAGINEVPPINPDPAISQVMPNQDDGERLDEPVDMVGGFKRIYAPRANDGIRTLGATVKLPDAIRFVREVWVQTNHPNFNRAAATDTRYPAANPNLPPYTLAVTVRVFLRDSAASQFSLKGAIWPYPPANSSLIPRDGLGRGLGYLPGRPLAEVVGIFSLRRNL